MRDCKRIAAIVLLSLAVFLPTTLAWAQACQSCSTGVVTPPAVGPLPPIEEIPGPGPIDSDVAACLGATREIRCKPDGSGYLYSFSVTNNTGQPVTAVLVTPPLNSFTISPQSPPIPGGVLANGGTVILTVTISGAYGGQKICFPVTLMTEGRSCCTINMCVELPNCCARITDKVECNKDGSYNWTFIVTNTTTKPVQHVYLYPPAGVTFTPSYFGVSIPAGGTSQPLTVKITGGQPGAKLCFDMSLHTPEMKTCCTFRQCIQLPLCGPPPVDVSLVKKFTQGAAANSGTYTLSVKNESSPLAAGTIIKITDPVPTGVTLTGFAGSPGGWTCSPMFPVTGANTLTCSFSVTTPIATGALLPPLNINATLAPAGSDIGIYQNCATVAASAAAGAITDSNPLNNRSCAVTKSINPEDCLTTHACPQPVPGCKQDVLLIVDASLSVGNGLSSVLAAINQFLLPMQNKGGRVNIFSFNNQPNWKAHTSGWTTVTTASPIVTPIVLGGTRTNWDDALERAFGVVQATTPKPLVLFITDGDPNAYNTPAGSEIQNATPVVAATEAVQWINAIRGAGSPIIALGFGQVASAGYLDAAFTGNSTNPGSVTLETSGVIKMNDASALPGVMATLGNQLCGTISLNKRIVGSNGYSHPITPGTFVSVSDPFQFVLELTNNSTTAMSGLDVQDQIPTDLKSVTVTPPTLGATVSTTNLLKWSNIALPARQTTTLGFTGKIVKTYTAPATDQYRNYAQVTAAPTSYAATQINDMPATAGPANEPDESFADFFVQAFQPQPDQCAAANRPDWCYLSVSKNRKDPTAEDGSCKSAPAGGPATPCAFTISVDPNPTYVPATATVMITDTFTVNGNTVSNFPATVPTALCPTATPTAVGFTCNHGSTTPFTGTMTVMIPAGQTGPLQNCITAKITNATPPLNISTVACTTF